MNGTPRSAVPFDRSTSDAAWMTVPPAALTAAMASRDDSPVVTTGLSSREAIAAVTAAGGTVIHAASLVDRSNGKADLGVPFTPLIRLDVPSYAADALPPELAAIPAVKPGSRAA